MAALQKRARMITASPLARQPTGPTAPATWRRLLAQAVTDPRELLQLLEPDRELLAALPAAAAFPMRLPVLPYCLHCWIASAAWDALHSPAQVGC